MRFLEQTTFPLEKCPDHVNGESTLESCETYTDLLRSSLIARISIFLRPIFLLGFAVALFRDRGLR